jgi:AcrR family transcriptional regulator
VLSTEGRPLGRRGIETRERILRSVEDLVEKNGVRGLRLADIAESVGFSPPAFYQYFRDIDDALLALNEEIGELFTMFSDSLARDWDGEAGFEHVLEFVERFTQYWDDHRAVLWARNLAAQDGDERFRNVRNKSLAPVAQALARKVESAQAAGTVDASVAPVALAASLMMMLERMGMVYPDLDWMGVGRDDLARSVAITFHRMVDRAPGAPPPG